MPEKPQIIFDGVCNLCNWAVDFVLRKDCRETFTFTAHQSDRGKKLLADLGLNNSGLYTIYLIENKKVYVKSTAVLKILKNLPFPWRLLYSFTIIPKFIRNRIYDLVARNRYNWFGKRNLCRVPSEKEKSRFLG
jgi:predicted DCC family thiol-disulfide oxidoreductase YuxK